jgi:tetratricopeptide (TPR) repeat protein
VKGAPAAPAEPSFEQRVAELEQAGNWNVLVLYATEWARKEPANGRAWHKLAQGYVKLGQLPEAAEASAKAVQLAPADVAVWGDAAAVYAALERWPQARAAYERVLTAAPADTRALCGAALVARREGRFADADAFTARASGAGSACAADGVQGVAASAAVPAARGRR